MDASRFESLTRALTGSTRRRFSRALAGLGLVGGLGLLAGFDGAMAKKKRHKNRKQCKGETKRCGKQCIPELDCCTDEECGDASLGLICVDGDCICGSRRGLSIQAC